MVGRVMRKANSRYYEWYEGFLVIFWSKLHIGCVSNIMLNLKFGGFSYSFYVILNLCDQDLYVTVISQSSNIVNTIWFSNSGCDTGSIRFHKLIKKHLLYSTVSNQPKCYQSLCFLVQRIKSKIWDMQKQKVNKCWESSKS